MWLKYVPGISFRTDNEPFKVNNGYQVANKIYFFSNENIKITLIVLMEAYVIYLIYLFLIFGCYCFVLKTIIQKAMQGFTEKIVGMLKSERLFASQGGPIIMSQV